MTDLLPPASGPHQAPAPSAEERADDAAVERAIELLRSVDLGLSDADAGRRALAGLLRSVAGAPRRADEAPGRRPRAAQDLADPAALPGIIEDWSRAAGVPAVAFREDRRAFLRGDHLGFELSPRLLVRAAVRRLRKVGALPEEHRISLVWTGDQPSATLPVRIPDWTAVALPTRPVALSAQYVHHELGHVMELAWRPPDLPLAARWQAPDSVVEWVAMVVEWLSRCDDWLTALGLEAERARQVGEHCRYEDHYTRAFAALVLHCAGVRPERLERELKETVGELIDPGHLREEVRRADYWRTVAQGHARADATVDVLRAAHGARWWERPESWRRLRADVTAQWAATREAGER
ncbi:hypothetical protein ACWCPS_17040 [Streptomyces mauvecolor]